MGGTRENLSSWYFKFISLNEGVVPQKAITAVVGVLFPLGTRDLIIAVENKRGLDIPGGHLEPGENYEQALKRECREEANATLRGIYPLALLESDRDEDKKTYILVCKAACSLRPFCPTAEIAQRYIMTPEHFLQNYFGNRTLMKKILRLTQIVKVR